MKWKKFMAAVLAVSMIIPQTASQTIMTAEFTQGIEVSGSDDFGDGQGNDSQEDEFE